MPDDPVTELEVECDIDGPGGLPPLKARFEMSDSFRNGYIVGTVVMTAIYLGIATIV
jgi:hypothetical protein